MLMPRHHNAGYNHYMKTANTPSENVEKFEYLRKTVTN
jgi:hypothetical protein